MRFRLAASSRLSIGLFAFVGVLSAHWLAYFVSAPARFEREHLLVSTGHRDWSLVGALAVGAFTAGIASAAWGRLRRGGPQPSTADVAWRLALLQTLGFLVLEAAERAAAGGRAADALTEPVVALGVLMQVLVALAGALVTRFVIEAMDRLVSGPPLDHKRAPRRAGHGAERVDDLRRTGTNSGSGTLRGPPSTPAAI